ncbi:flagellar biosynthesis protein FliQ [Chengkuizengella axinellae]|uniref:Flagellar biosynthetic protein FliQ n=1 Tax=Chengkuizengella axinellae TaxID=3064388 RepID=A0ABT9IVR4_9BACL|nr:flagellar biosynthesis protein FliQ [Chengkuizengella sp. 2205SS18-9]MDP5273454.1 flagellar biosynthesis protein FliQ [Chengkuizengella sp. 2205SS18-9]
MTSNFIIELAAEAVWIVLKVSAPMILLALAVGLIVSILQATTQIQEQTLAFVPKIVAVFIALLIFGEWILTILVDFTSNIFNNLHLFIG